MGCRTASLINGLLKAGIDDRPQGAGGARRARCGRVWRHLRSRRRPRWPRPPEPRARLAELPRGLARWSRSARSDRPRAGGSLRQRDALARLDEVRVHWLGKKGLLTEQLKSLGTLPASGASRRRRRRSTKPSWPCRTAIEARRAVLERVAVERKLEPRSRRRDARRARRSSMAACIRSRARGCASSGCSREVGFDVARRARRSRTTSTTSPR